MKTITKEKYYHALALYILARRNQAEVDDFEAEMNDLLEQPEGSLMGDAIYNYENTGTKEEFDKCLKLMEIEVETQ